MKITELESFTEISAKIPGLQRKGLKRILHHIAQRRCIDGMEKNRNIGFVPDATRFVRQPGAPGTRDEWDETIELWEIENTQRVSQDKFLKIQMFANDIFDLAGIFTEIHVLDAVRGSQRKAYDSRDDVLADHNAAPKQWLDGDDWRE